MGAEALSALPPLSQVPTDVLEALWQSGTARQLRHRTHIYQHGQAPERVCLLLSGVAFVYTLTLTGQRRILWLCQPGTVVNPNALTAHPASAHCEMLTDGQVLWVNAKQFSGLMEGCPALLRGVLDMQRGNMLMLGELLQVSSTGVRMEFRMAFALRVLCERFGQEGEQGVEIGIPLSVSFLGDLLGIPRETASRARKALAQQGLLMSQGRLLTLPDLPGLERYLARERPESGILKSE